MEVGGCDLRFAICDLLICCCHFQFYGGLALVGDAFTDAQQGRDGIEQAAAGRGLRAVEVLVYLLLDDAKFLLGYGRIGCEMQPGNPR